MIGNGSFGFVYKAIIRSNKYTVAAKLMDMKFMTKLPMKSLKPQIDYICVEKELEANLEVVSPFVCKLLGYGRDPTIGVFLLMEYMENGSLEDYIVDIRKKKVETTLLRRLKMMLNITSGLADIHSKNFIHADLKPKNILLNSNNVAKICDLGSVKNLNFNCYDNPTGARFYLPPEFYQNKYDNRIDVYSFGLIMYHLFSGKRHKIKGKGKHALKHISRIPLSVVSCLVRKATSLNPNERKFILYYRNILYLYVILLEDLFDVFDLTDVKDQDLIVMGLNDSIVELLNTYYGVGLEFNLNNNLSQQSKLDEESLIRLAKAIKFINALKTNPVLNLSKLPNIEGPTLPIKFY